MAFKKKNLRWGISRLLGQMAGLVGMRRTRDLLYVRLLVGFLTRKKAAVLYDHVAALSGDGEIA
jgi:hypothetical protein